MTALAEDPSDEEVWVVAAVNSVPDLMIAEAEATDTTLVATETADRDGVTVLEALRADLVRPFRAEASRVMRTLTRSQVVAVVSSIIKPPTHLLVGSTVTRMLRSLLLFLI
jgi:hypothetical protein